MDDFDAFNQNNQVTETLDEQNTNQQEEDLFGSEYTNNTTTVTSTNPFSNEQQQNLSWDITDVRKMILHSSEKSFFHLGFR
jgi:hypothetical protein